jgi:hypothetical protein
MRRLLPVCLAASILVILCGCKERRATTVTHDACNLLSKEEIESVQAAAVNETKSSERSDDSFRVAQCFYTTAEFSKSVSLALVQKNPHQQNNHSPRDFWKERFGPHGDEKERNEKAKTKSIEKERATALKKIGDLGDDAYWVSNRFGGVLYVLKGEAFISIGLGGMDDEDTKLKKSKVLAQKALERL